MLEIGVGLGTDLLQFARAGAAATGVDLTGRAVELVRRRLRIESLAGEVKVGDAERLPFAHNSFDRVYSWGLCTHTPDTGQAVREAIRVARPGGKTCVMLYGRHFWVAVGLSARHMLLRGRPNRSLSDVLAHHMESDRTKGFTVEELQSMFTGLEELRVEPVATPYDRRVAGPLADLTGRWWDGSS